MKLNQKIKLKINQKNKKIILIIIISLFFIFCFWQFNLRIILADRFFYQALKERNQLNWQGFLENYKKILIINSKEPYYQSRFALDLLMGLEFYPNNESKIKVLELATNGLNRIESMDQIFEIKLYFSRILLTKAALTQESSDFVLARQAIQDTVALSPQMAELYQLWCQLEIQQRNYSEALVQCGKAFDLYPSLSHPGMNEDHRRMVKSEMAELYEKFGQIYFEQKKYFKAEQMYQQALKLTGRNRPNLWKKIGDIYYLQGDIKTALKKNLHGYALNPQDSNWPLAISLLYQEKGDEENYLKYYQRYLELNQESLE